jgi:protein-S-isoprenylcysteine O-methyltransferase Ste14
VRVLRALWNASAVSLIAGLGGGLLLGWLLSRGGSGWLTPLPWLIYLVVLVAFSAALSLLWPVRTVRRDGAAETPPTSAAGSEG